MNFATPSNHSGYSTLTQSAPLLLPARDGASRTRLLFVLLALLCACADQAAQIALNSDLIRQKFGSYGVAVLYASSEQRISSLYSIDRQDQVTRTFAVVDFQRPIPPELAAEHARVSTGASIGEVFRAAGWRIEKHHIFIGELEVGETHARIGHLMGIPLPRELAAHAYRFVAASDDTSLNYATITEIHHPEFLDVAALTSLYGEMLFDDSARKSLDDLVTLPAGF
jgi:hypothetical protein